MIYPLYLWMVQNDCQLGIACAGLYCLLVLRRVSLRRQETSRRSFAAHIQKADGYLRDKQPALAIPEFQAAVAIDPEMWMRRQSGRSAVLSGKAADSIPHFRARWLRAKKSGSPAWRRFKGCWNGREPHAGFCRRAQGYGGGLPRAAGAALSGTTWSGACWLYTQSGDWRRRARHRAVRKADPIMRRCSMPPIAPIPICR